MSAPNPMTTTHLARIQTDPSSSDQPTATAFFGTTIELNGTTFEAPWTTVTWPLLEIGKSVTLQDGTTLTYAQISEGVTTIAYTEKAILDATTAAAALSASGVP